jgi:hypothetical protein
MIRRILMLRSAIEGAHIVTRVFTVPPTPGEHILAGEIRFHRGERATWRSIILTLANANNRPGAGDVGVEYDEITSTLLRVPIGVELPSTDTTQPTWEPWRPRPARGRDARTGGPADDHL